VARRSTASDVFINIPFDRRNEYLYLSLIAAIVGLGLAPRCVVEIPHDAARLKRIFDLIRSCEYSIHADLYPVPQADTDSKRASTK
jgi:hypothetical protein